MFGGFHLSPMALDTDNLASSVKASSNSLLLEHTGGATHRWNIVPSGRVSLLTCRPMLIASAQSLYWGAVYLVWCSPFRSLNIPWTRSHFSLMSDFFLLAELVGGTSGTSSESQASLCCSTMAGMATVHHRTPFPFDNCSFTTVWRSTCD